MKAWGWGFMSFAAFWIMVTGIKSWQFAVLLVIVGIVMVIKGKAEPKDGNSEDDKSAH